MKLTPLPFTVRATIAAGLPVYASGALQRREYLFEVVPVDLHRIPSEGPPLVGQGFELHHLVGPPVVLDAVAVHDGDQVVQRVVGGGHRGLPHLPLVALSPSPSST